MHVFIIIIDNFPIHLRNLGDQNNVFVVLFTKEDGHQSNLAYNTIF